MAKEETTGTGVVLEAARRGKMRKIVELGFDPWGRRFDDHLSAAQIRDKESEIVTEPSAEPEEKPTRQAGEGEVSSWRKPEPVQHGPKVRAAGRIILQRKKGKLIFLDIWDWTGKIQVLIGASQVGPQFWELAQCFDLGDLIGVDGELKKTRTGELSIFAEQLHFLSKSLETPPAKFHGLTDPELRSRLRYVDLVHTEGVLQRMLNRTKIIRSIRETLAAERFVEVEGPTLHAVAGGAAARPFVTHHNALNVDLYLRIALELHLKRLLVGGIERVYELGRVFRNEGVDQTHNPEFTMLELYQAYGDYRSMMDVTEKLVTAALRATGQGTHVTWNDREIDFTTPFVRKTYFEAFQEHTGVDPREEHAVRKYAESIHVETEGRHPDVILNGVFEESVEPALTGPVFITDYPASLCPLTKRKSDDPLLAERFELFVHGMEVANAYTELNDPDLQEQLFRRQLSGLKEEESMAKMDRDFIRALRNAMPPAGGLGIGIDRLVMILTNTTSIREVILFPLLRPEA